MVGREHELNASEIHFQETVPKTDISGQFRMKISKENRQFK